MANRTIEVTKKALKPFITNVFINTDHFKGPDSGLSAGYGLMLAAESTTGAQLSAEVSAAPGELPEELAQKCCSLLISEIFKGGFADTSTQPLALMLMALCPEDVSKIRIGKLSLFS